MRDLFTDRWNSFWHFIFGFLGSFYRPVLDVFITYQMVDPLEHNMLIDIYEGIIGYIVGIYFILLNRLRHQA
jgi:hypothetical protein